jgi:hypothetical protein
MLARQQAVADDGVFVHPDESARFADAATLLYVVQDGNDLVLRQGRPKQRRSLALGKTSLAGRAIEHAALLVGAIVIANAQVAGTSFAMIRAVWILATKLGQIVHDSPSVARLSKWASQATQEKL